MGSTMAAKAAMRPLPPMSRRSRVLRGDFVIRLVNGRNRATFFKGMKAAPRDRSKQVIALIEPANVRVPQPGDHPERPRAHPLIGEALKLAGALCSYASGDWLDAEVAGIPADAPIPYSLEGYRHGAHIRIANSYQGVIEITWANWAPAQLTAFYEASIHTGRLARTGLDTSSK